MTANANALAAHVSIPSVGPDVIGESIGSYRVLSELGKGGMGSVYLAEHRHLGRKAAIKVLQRELAQRPDLLERFFSEARATSMIDHPGIVQVLDCDLAASGQPFIVMEYLTGETLMAFLRRRGTLAAHEAAAFSRQIAEALGAAHAKGIIHRDVKPDNVFVTGEQPAAIKLVDFGIAKLAGDFAGGPVSRTQTGVMMGTPLYMSPEQCRGAGAVDARTDVYSLGCILFEMLCGRPPFVFQGVGELVTAHMTQAPPGTRTLNPTVPPGLEQLVNRLLAKSPGDRPQDMQQVAEALMPFEDGGSATAQAPRATMPRPAAGSTTFQSTASQIIAPEDRPDVPRKRLPVLPMAAAGVAIAVLASLIFARGGGQTVTPIAATPPAMQPAPTPAPPAVEPAPAPAPAPTPAPAQTSVRITITSNPPGAQICLKNDRRLIDTDGLELPRNRKKLSFFVHLPGHRLEEIALGAERDQRKTVNLTRLGPDDLEADSPCRR